MGVDLFFVWSPPRPLEVFETVGMIALSCVEGVIPNIGRAVATCD